MDVNFEYLKSLKEIESDDATFFSKDPSLVIESGSGSYIKDVAGNIYIDMCAGFAACVLGHNHPAHQKIFNDYANSNSSFAPLMQGIGDVYASKVKVDLITKLKSLLPSHLSKVSLSISGSQAVETAIKTALLYTKKSGVICFRGCYHGLDFGTLALNDKEFFKTGFNSWICADNVVFCDYNSTQTKQQIQTACEILAKNNIELAAILVEPVQGRAGVKPARLDWLWELRNICNERNCLLIYDEIFTGLGRTGQITFASEVSCDILCLGKALGGGMPLSCCVGTTEVMNAWPENKGEAMHTGTFFGHPLSCHIALATLNEIVTHNLCKRSIELGNIFIEHLKSNLKNNPKICQIGGKGLMVGIEFTDKMYGITVAEMLRKEKVIAIPSGIFGECISFSPALTVEESTLEAVSNILKMIL